jgi:transposase-like protein
VVVQRRDPPVSRAVVVATGPPTSAARPNGTKGLIAVEDGYRESAESWKLVLRELKRRGMHAPVVAVDDGVLGFWAAVRDVWPKTACSEIGSTSWATSSTSCRSGSSRRMKAALHKVMHAETRGHAREAITRFATEYGAKYPKAVTTFDQDADALLTFFDLPAEHWKHLRTFHVRFPPKIRGLSESIVDRANLSRSFFGARQFMRLHADAIGRKSTVCPKV